MLIPILGMGPLFINSFVSKNSIHNNNNIGRLNPNLAFEKQIPDFSKMPFFSKLTKIVEVSVFSNIEAKCRNQLTLAANRDVTRP